jgi:hypothetical protein
MLIPQKASHSRLALLWHPHSLVVDFDENRRLESLLQIHGCRPSLLVIRYLCLQDGVLLMQCLKDL